MKNSWTNLSAVSCAALMMGLISGCASSVDKVVEDRGTNMESIYARYAGGDREASFEQRKRELNLRDADERSVMTGFPPNSERVKHLFPKLPNPDLFMYVRPHAVGVSGAPIPAYITRFTLYEKTHYALPGETVETIRRNTLIDEAIKAEDREAVIAAEAEAKRRNDQARIQAY